MGSFFLQTSFLVSPQFIPKEKTMLLQMPFLAYQLYLLHCPLSLFHWLSSLLATQEGDYFLRGPIHKAEQRHKDFNFLEGPHGRFLMFQGQLVIPYTQIHKVLSEMYNKRGHFGQKRTLKMCKKRFWWQKKSSTIQFYCLKCVKCKRVKLDLKKPAGL